MKAPDFGNVPHQAHNILITELEGSSKELYLLLNNIIQNSDFLSEKAKKPINSVQELINYLNEHSIDGLRRLLS